MSGTAIAAGLPCGMWREHTKKFSPQVHVRREQACSLLAASAAAVMRPTVVYWC